MKWIWEPGETEQMLALRPNEAKAVAKLLLKQRNDIQKSTITLRICTCLERLQKDNRT